MKRSSLIYLITPSRLRATAVVVGVLLVTGVLSVTSAPDVLVSLAGAVAL